MQEIKFTYTTPMIGEFTNEGPDLSIDEITKEIERDFPEADDIEVFEVITKNG